MEYGWSSASEWARTGDRLGIPGTNPVAFATREASLYD
jgi:hypothetical protein